SIEAEWGSGAPGGHAERPRSVKSGHAAEIVERPASSERDRPFDADPRAAAGEAALLLERESAGPGAHQAVAENSRRIERRGDEVRRTAGLGGDFGNAEAGLNLHLAESQSDIAPRRKVGKFVLLPLGEAAGGADFRVKHAGRRTERRSV